MVHAFLAADEEAAKAAAREPFRRYLRSSTEPWRVLFATTGRPLPQMVTEADLDAVLDIAVDRYFEQSGLFGLPDRRRRAGGRRAGQPVRGGPPAGQARGRHGRRRTLLRRLVRTPQRHAGAGLEELIRSCACVINELAVENQALPEQAAGSSGTVTPLKSHRRAET